MKRELTRIAKWSFGIVLLTFLSCNTESETPQQDEEQDVDLPNTPMPEVSKIDGESTTMFAVYLEEEVGFQKNVVYAPTLGMAWNEIMQVIATDRFDFTNKRVEGLDSVKSYIDVLSDDEFETTVKVEGDQITATANFKKILMFEEPFDLYEYLTWSETDQALKAFDFYGYHEQVDLNYYNSDDDFSFTLIPKEDDHQIILMMIPTDSVHSMGDVFDYYINQTSDTVLSRKTEWMLDINEDDHGVIPNFAFNLACDFEDVVGSFFSTSLTTYQIIEFYQRNAFVLDETGAIVESEAVVSTEDTMAAPPEEMIEPKDMRLDRPFFLFLKKTDSDTPYFAIYIKNTDLLVKK